MSTLKFNIALIVDACTNITEFETIAWEAAVPHDAIWRFADDNYIFTELVSNDKFGSLIILIMQLCSDVLSEFFGQSKIILFLGIIFMQLRRCTFPSCASRLIYFRPTAANRWLSSLPRKCSLWFVLARLPKVNPYRMSTMMAIPASSAY